ncbi:MAG: OmpP1/FadL family transporter [Thermodesulfobacteriota bacterium]
MTPTRIRTLFAAAFVAMAATPALATNGMNMIGYNVRASGMGGADVAIATDCSGTACNPATLGVQHKRSLAFGLSALMPQVSTAYDAFGVDVENEDQVFPLPYVAYAQQLSEDSPWTIGIDLFAQGGMGVDVHSFPTPNGNGSYDSLVRYERLTGAASYRVNEKLSLGLGVMIGYADIEFSLFPEFPGGIRVEDLYSFGYAGRAGLRYQLSERVSLGAQYTSAAGLDLDGGTLTANYGPAGNVTFDAEMEDFTWPQEAEVGIAFQATPNLLIAADIKWIGWSEAIDLVKVRASGGPPGMPAPVTPGSDAILFDMNWDDQWVYALGIEYVLNQNHTFRLGYNYGKTPVLDANLSPLFPAIVEHHATLGYRLTLNNWAIDLAYEHGFDNRQENSNPDPQVNPFGPGVSISHSQNTLHGAIIYFF